MVSVSLPEACAVVRYEFDACNPFGSLPGVQLRNDAASGAAVFCRKRFSIVSERDQRVFCKEVADRKISRPPVVVTVADDVLSFG